MPRIPRLSRVRSSHPHALSPNVLEVPHAVVQRAHLARLQPARYAVEVECMLETRQATHCAPVSARSGDSRVHRRARRTLHTPRAIVHSSFVDDSWFAWHSMPGARRVSADGAACRAAAPHTEIHDVVAANRACVHVNVCRGADAAQGPAFRRQSLSRTRGCSVRAPLGCAACGQTYQRTTAPRRSTVWRACRRQDQSARVLRPTHSAAPGSHLSDFKARLGICRGRRAGGIVGAARSLGGAGCGGRRGCCRRTRVLRIHVLIHAAVK